MDYWIYSEDLAAVVESDSSVVTVHHSTMVTTVDPSDCFKSLHLTEKHSFVSGHSYVMVRHWIYCCWRQEMGCRGDEQLSWQLPVKVYPVYSLSVMSMLSFPTTLVAMQVYTPALASDTLVSVMDPLLFFIQGSPLYSHCILGLGIPFATQGRITPSPSMKVIASGPREMTGGTAWKGDITVTSRCNVSELLYPCTSSSACWGRLAGSSQDDNPCTLCTQKSPVMHNRLVHRSWLKHILNESKEWTITWIGFVPGLLSQVGKVALGWMGQLSCIDPLRNVPSGHWNSREELNSIIFLPLDCDTCVPG